MLKAQSTTGKAPFLAAIFKIACWFVTEMWNLGHKWNVCVKISGHLKNYTTSSKVAGSNITPNPKGFCPSENQMPTKNLPPTPLHPPQRGFVFKSSLCQRKFPSGKEFLQQQSDCIIVLSRCLYKFREDKLPSERSSSADFDRFGSSLGFFSLPCV